MVEGTLLGRYLEGGGSESGSGGAIEGVVSYGVVDVVEEALEVLVLSR